MYAVIVSILLPFFSHVIRQSLACTGDAPPLTFTVFMMVYSISMCFHSVWIDTCFTIGARSTIMCFSGTFLAAVCTKVFAAEWFIIAWSLHAVASSSMWPIAYRLINLKKRSRTTLVLWSLQGNIGDLCGCLYRAFGALHTEEQYYMTYTTTCLLIVSLLCICACFPRTTLPLVAQVQENRESATEMEVVLLQPYPHRRHHRKLLSFTIVSSACIKTITYTASNFMPSLHLNYNMYALGGACGTLAAGVLADLHYTKTALIASSTVLVTSNFIGYFHTVLWTNTLYCINFGVMSSLLSSFLSICVCTHIADITKKYGQSTAIIDGGATIVSAIIQLWTPLYFPTIQCAASISLCIFVLVLCSSIV